MSWQSLTGTAGHWWAWLVAAAPMLAGAWRLSRRLRGAAAGAPATAAAPWYRRWAAVGLAPLYLAAATLKLRAAEETIRQLRAINGDLAATIARYEARHGPLSDASTASSSGSPAPAPSGPTPSGSPMPSMPTSGPTG